MWRVVRGVWCVWRVTCGACGMLWVNIATRVTSISNPGSTASGALDRILPKLVLPALACCAAPRPSPELAHDLTFTSRLTALRQRLQSSTDGTGRLRALVRRLVLRILKMQEGGQRRVEL